MFGVCLGQMPAEEVVYAVEVCGDVRAAIEIQGRVKLDDNILGVLDSGARRREVVRVQFTYRLIEIRNSLIIQYDNYLVSMYAQSRHRRTFP